MKFVQFKFEKKGFKNNKDYFFFDVSKPENLDLQDNPFAGTLPHTYPDRHDYYNPQEWVDSYNDWDSEEGNVWKNKIGECIGFHLILEESYLRDQIEDALKKVANHGWSGWGVALHLHTNGEITISDIISNSTWSESDDFDEILRIETWNVDYTIEKWFAEVKKNQYTEEDKVILAKIEKLREDGNFSLENLSEKAKYDYENAYDIAQSEDISTAIDYYIEKLKEEENFDISIIL